MEKITSKSGLYNELIWGNRLFTINNKCLYSKNFIENNILYIKDILQTDGKLLPNLHQKMKDKRTYFRDITMIMKTLIPFKDIRFT